MMTRSAIPSGGSPGPALDTARCQLVECATWRSPPREWVRSGGKGGVFCHTPLVAVARNLGRKRALEMALTGDVISAATAAEWGLINRAVPDAELDAAVDDLLRRATRGSVLSKALGKRGFYAQVDLPQVDAYAYAMELMASTVVTPDGQEGINSFLEKRKPNFTQRAPHADGA